MIVLTRPKTQMQRLVRMRQQAARAFVAPASQYVSAAGAFALPLTLSAWMSGTTAFSLRICVANLSGQYYAMAAEVAGGSRLSAMTSSGGSSVSTTTLPSSSYHAAAVFSGPSYRVIYLDGIPATPNTATYSFASLDRARLSGNARYGGSYFTGSMTWPCIWSAALVEFEIQALARGVPPWAIRPESIVACPDMESLYDPYLGASWTNNGTTLAEGPRFYRPSRTIFIPQSLGGVSRLIGPPASLIGASLIGSGIK